MKLASALFLALSLSTASALDCLQNEAQFIGKVREATIIRIDQGTRDCAYKMTFQVFNQSVICPIDRTLAKESDIIDYNCRYGAKPGDVISGILIQGMDSKIVIEE